MLVESAWTYRHPPRIGAKKLYLLQQVTPSVRDIAWKAQTRLTGRYRALIGREDNGGLHGDCARACWLRVVGRPGGADQLRSSASRRMYLAHGSVR